MKGLHYIRSFSANKTMFSRMSFIYFKLLFFLHALSHCPFNTIPRFPAFGSLAAGIS